MKKKIGIFIDSSKNSGGAFQEAKYTLNLIKKDLLDIYDVIILSPDKMVLEDLKALNFQFKLIQLNKIQRYILYLKNFSGFFRRIKKISPIRFLFKNKFENFLRKNNIFFLYFLGPSSYSLYLEDTNFAITVPDIAHISSNEFPEVSADGELVRKKEIFENSLSKAYLIITNCEYLKNQISYYYKVDKKKILIQPHLPSTSFDNFKFKPEISKNIKSKYNLPNKYIFYPAQYWLHKNHTKLVEVIKKFKDDKIDVSLVTCGSDKGILAALKEYVKKLKIESKVTFLDFVSDEELPYLYQNSTALVMPTHIGPTNIPPWEAFNLGVPVIYSNLEGAKEIYDDAVIYINPNDVNSIYNAIEQIYTKQELRQKLINNGRELLKRNMAKNNVVALKNNIKNLESNLSLNITKNI